MGGWWKVSESPELELIYGALAEISDRLEKINKNLIELNTILERMWREGLIVKGRLSP